MCVLCGTPDPSHDLVLVRIALLASGTGFILAPRRVLSRITQEMRGNLGRVKTRLGHQIGR